MKRFPSKRNDARHEKMATSLIIILLLLTLAISILIAIG